MGNQWMMSLSLIASIGFGILSTASATSAACDAVVGKWTWFAGGEVTIKGDGTFTQQSGNSGTWDCLDSGKGAVALKWKQGGYLNRLVLADGGTKLVSTASTSGVFTIVPRRGGIGDGHGGRSWNRCIGAWQRFQ